MSRPTSQPAAPPECPQGLRLNPRDLNPRLLCVLGIAGTGSNAGKTTLAAEIISLLAQRRIRTAALKVTRAHDGECPIGDASCQVCSTAGSSFRIVSDERTLRMRGKDTGRYAEAGADPVRWLITNPASVAEGVRAVLAQFTQPCLLVAEGNSLCDFVAVDRLVLVCGAQQPKPSTQVLLPRVTQIIGDAATASALPQSASIPCWPAQEAAERILNSIPALTGARGDDALARLRAGL